MFDAFDAKPAGCGEQLCGYAAQAEASLSPAHAPFTQLSWLSDTKVGVGIHSPANRISGKLVNYSRFSLFLKSERFSPVLFLKKRLKADKSSKPRMSAISFALFELYSNNRFASVATRS